MIKIRYDNLQLLADKLKTVPQKHFDMKEYRSDSNGMRYFLGFNDCGTVGCALGHAPFIKGLEPIQSDYVTNKDEVSLKYLSFDHRYCKRIFGLHAGTNGACWCFSESWEFVDNTPKGASKRIEYFVKNHRVPDNWEEQMDGEDEYMFQEDKNE